MNSAAGLPPAIRKAAILIATLDQPSADALLDKMGSEQAARVRHAMLELGEVAAAEQEQVMRAFLQAGGPPPEPSGAEADPAVAEPRTEHAGHDEPSHPLPAPDRPPFRVLREATSDALARHLQHEHAQTIAVVAAHLPAERSAELVARLAPRLQAEVLRRIAELDAADPEVIQDVERELETRLADDIRAARNRTEGLAAVTSILTAAGRRQPELMQSLSRHDRELIALIDAARAAAPPSAESRPAPPPPPDSPRGKPGPAGAAPLAAAARVAAAAAAETTFEFECLIELDDQGLATLFREANPQIVLLALAGASPRLVDRITSHLPAREARSLLRKMEQIGPLRLTDIEQAQREIAQLVGRLAACGSLQLPAAKRFAVAA